MGQLFRDLRPYYKDFVDEVDPSELLPLLMDCLTKSDMEAVDSEMKYNGGRQKGAMKLVTVMDGKVTLIELINALNETKYKSLAQRIAGRATADNQNQTPATSRRQGPPSASTVASSALQEPQQITETTNINVVNYGIIAMQCGDSNCMAVNSDSSHAEQDSQVSGDDQGDNEDFEVEVEAVPNEASLNGFHTGQGTSESSEQVNLCQSEPCLVRLEQSTEASSLMSEGQQSGTPTNSRHTSGEQSPGQDGYTTLLSFGVVPRTQLSLSEGEMEDTKVMKVVDCTPVLGAVSNNEFNASSHPSVSAVPATNEPLQYCELEQLDLRLPEEFDSTSMGTQNGEHHSGQSSTNSPVMEATVGDLQSEVTQVVHHKAVVPETVATCGDLTSMSLESMMIDVAHSQLSYDKNVQIDTEGPLRNNKIIDIPLSDNSMSTALAANDISSATSDVAQNTMQLVMQIDSLPGHHGENRADAEVIAESVHNDSSYMDLETDSEQHSWLQKGRRMANTAACFCNTYWHFL
jgi:hypothetical protein